MRFMNEVTFVELGKEFYDADTSDYVRSDDVKTVANVNVTDLGIGRSVVLFGSVKEGRKVIRVMPHYEIPKFDYIEFDSKNWQLVKDTKPQYRNSLIVEEYHGEE